MYEVRCVYVCNILASGWGRGQVEEYTIHG